MKYHKIVTVRFFKVNFADVLVKLEEGKTLAECVKMKDPIIDGFFHDDGTFEEV